MVARKKTTSGSLATARQRIEQLGGHLEVCSDGGEATFVLTTLPLRAEARRLWEAAS